MESGRKVYLSDIGKTTGESGERRNFRETESTSRTTAGAPAYQPGAQNYWASVGENRLRRPYDLLKQGPALSLASEQRERPDVRPTVILGYN
jgi:hypothetical protein